MTSLPRSGSCSSGCTSRLYVLAFRLCAFHELTVSALQSGQGPYFGQKAWFTFFHSEKNITSAIDRYANEIRRVVGVLDGQLAKTGGWLVGSKCTYADLSFVPWDNMIGFIMGEDGQSVFDNAPHFKKWHEAMSQRPAVKKVNEYKAKVNEKK